MSARNGSRKRTTASPGRKSASGRRSSRALGYEVVAYGKVSHYKHTVDYGFDSFAHDGFHEDVAIPEAVKFLQKRGKTDKPLCLMVGTNCRTFPGRIPRRDTMRRKSRQALATIDTAESAGGPRSLRRCREPARTAISVWS